MQGLSVGVIGAGSMAGVHVPCWRQLGARVTVCSDDGNAAALAAAHQVDTVDSVDELLDRCELIDICTPSHTHKELALLSAKAGRHIVCEKPLALHAGDAEEMIDAAEHAGVHLFPGHVVRYFPEYAAAAEKVTAGAIGELAVLRFSRSGRNPSTWKPWFSDPELSGGILVDQMIHDFDYARWVAGDVNRVYAQIRHADDGTVPLGRRRGPGKAAPVVSATAVLTHASGAVSHVQGVWGLPGNPFRTTFRLAGTHGLLQHDSERTRAVRVVAEAGGPGEVIPPKYPLTRSPYLDELREFAVAVAGGPAPRVGARDGLAALRIADAARESVRTDRAVTVAGGAR
ncbi:Gfo/Idh/MocA family protein [Streptomyces monticola]|uniref:Gfo/Idh/MocA family protein n=1 Tax=Streptomyces monticola TaxID=2666263 RepID=A0ABW2JQL1_9ACTN